MRLNEYNVQIVEPVKCKCERKWYRRLFSLTPFVKYHYEWVEVMENEKVIVNGRTLFMNSFTYYKLRRLQGE